ncbi:barstar family protein [Paraburkholderia sp. GAS333]|uniref:barstar family protein n=1 Tax=Paraburkholderia sp. GAS333 TaxID=3156279 RepID=UPI003D1C8042
MATIFVDSTEITDWPSFHSVFAQALGFPAFYGRNMDASIDCLSYLDVPAAEMTTVHVSLNETLAIQVGAVDSFRTRCPQQSNQAFSSDESANRTCVSHFSPQSPALNNSVRVVAMSQE